MQSESEKKKHRLVIIFGIIIGATGLLLIAAYILKAMIERAGEPDQSLLFWYLPFLFMGIITLIMGISLSIWGISSIRKNRIFGSRRSDVGPNS